jgi:hypothetical protein
MMIACSTGPATAAMLKAMAAAHLGLTAVIFESFLFQKQPAASHFIAQIQCFRVQPWIALCFFEQIFVSKK